MENRFGGLQFNHAPCFSGEDSKAENAVRGKLGVEENFRRESHETDRLTSGKAAANDVNQSR
jgi:hypothetical protein